MRLFVALFFIACFAGSISAQTERITNFDIQLEVHTDRSITVTETISVYANQQSIKRGIIRSLPTQRDRKGKSMKLDYDFIKLERDGKKEAYHTKQSGRDLLFYAGKKEVILDPGNYTYTLQYKVADQIFYFEDYDEIYWNGIGSSVIFPIDKASIHVTLPGGAKVIQDTAYIGNFGETGNDYQRETLGSILTYQSTRPLKPKEAFSIAIAFEKGLMPTPGILERLGTLIMVILGFLLLLPYYIYTWWRYGVDPPKPPAVPTWEPPQDLSPGSISYLHKGRHQSKGFTASMLNLAIKGYLNIEQIEEKVLFFKSKVYNIQKLKPSDETLPLEEKEIMHSLFAAGDVATIDGEYHAHVKEAYSDHQASQSAQHHAFLREGHNSRFLIAPILLTILIGAAAIFFLINNVDSDSVNKAALGTFIPLSLLGIILYTWLIKKPTMDKLELQSQIDGFKLYLEMAEADRLTVLNPEVSNSPAHFEAILPFAFALGVEHKWTQSFKSILEKAQYQPQWTNAHPVYFSSHFGRDFGRSVGTSSTQPNADGSGGGFSGSFGGGFAGGGGGGGGVGGW